jgi:hypothetical protein
MVAMLFSWEPRCAWRADGSSGLVAFERDLVHAHPTADGVILRCRPKLTLHQRKDILGRCENGEIIAEIPQSYNGHNNTISRI